MERQTLVTKSSKDYELIDSGREEKLERYGNVLLSRPDPQALWNKASSPEEWAKADARYVRQGSEGKWEAGKDLPKEWPIEFGGLTFLIRLTSFKHTGLFPEQEPNWEWVREVIRGREEVKVLNLFGYTGGASLAAAQAGAQVTHVDASKTAVAWARENAILSGLADKSIRWITEDVMVFVGREIKRGNKYDFILMDPPAFGHGPNDELWKIEEDLLPLMEACEKLISDKPVGILVNGYAAGYSPLAFAYNLEPFARKYGGEVAYGDLTIEEREGKRALPCGIFARWKA
ncbi:MAG TPA: class I SAM-dependent methyltransferase [Candidatus Paceibacterota bacterium]|nr:class I SAM-dependent methyltransferase [Candidatus Paceibacterota bacterium]